MIIRFLAALVLMFFSINTSTAQSDYLVGSSSESIEPDASLFSLALAGYGAPRDGRFTLTWKPVGISTDIKSITGLKDGFYAINENDELIEGSITAAGISWSKIGQAGEISSIAGLDGKLYGVNGSKELLVYDLSKPHPSWKKMGDANEISYITALNGRLFGLNNNNQLLFRSTENRKRSWEKVGDADSATSITGYGNRIYALHSDNSIWSKKIVSWPDEWVKIARYNAITYNIKVKHLAVLNDRLYAVADNGQVYVAEHSTDGNLLAKAIAIQQENKTVVIVGVDLVGVNYSLVNDVKSLISKKRNISPEAILVNVSHTHFAPVTQAWVTWGKFSHYPDSMYLNNIVKERMVKAIESALDNLKPANIFFGRGTTKIGYNRSSGTGEPYDNAVDVVKITDNNDKISSLLFLTGCHPVFRNAGKETYTMSANYPGVTKDILQQKAGVGNAIFLQGCAGDINPTDNDHQKSGMMLAIDVMSVLGTNMKKISGGISYAIDTIAIAVKPWSQEKIFQFKSENINKEGNVSAEKNVRWADLMLDKYKNGTMPASMPVYVQTINIGNWKLVGLSREVVTEYGMAIKELWPEKMISVAGYCNDVSSYLPTHRHISKGTYEGNESFFWYAQPALFPENVFEQIIQKIKLLNR